MFTSFLARMGEAVASAVVGLGGRRGQPEEQAFALAFMNSEAGPTSTALTCSSMAGVSQLVTSATRCASHPSCDALGLHRRTRIVST